MMDTIYMLAPLNIAKKNKRPGLCLLAQAYEAGSYTNPDLSYGRSGLTFSRASRINFLGAFLFSKGANGTDSLDGGQKNKCKLCVSPFTSCDNLIPVLSRFPRKRVLRAHNQPIIRKTLADG